MISQVTNAVGGAVSSSIGSTLGSLMNLVPVPGKLIMIPVKDFSGTIPTPAGPPYIAMFNPENWQTEMKVRYKTKAKEGQKGEQQDFDRQEAPTLTFDLLIDGTGASGQTREVLADILLLQKVILFDGSEHQPNQIFIIWGTQIFKGKTVSMNVRYTLFRPNGTPLRAVVTLGFNEHKPLDQLAAEEKRESADLTHRRLVQSNDRLDLICHYIYRNSRHYIDVAQVNQLTSFRKLPVGAELVYPPIEK